MSRMLLRNAYSKVRKPVKSLYNLLPEDKRLGRHFRETYGFLEGSQWWSREQHESYQLRQIKKLLGHAYLNVPYYRRVFDERGLKPGSIQSFDDLRQLPYLTRQIVQDNLKDMVAANYGKGDITAVTTGGSTSTPMGFYEDRALAEPRQAAFVAHQWSRVGYDPGRRNKLVVLRGIPIRGTYEYNGNNLILSSYKMSNDNMEKYVKLINSFKPDFLHVYPSTVAQLAGFITENGLKLDTPNLKAILTSSERINDSQKDYVEKAFGVRLFDFYGHAEHSCIAGECEKSRLYHLVDEYGYTELIGKGGKAALKDGEVGEIVCTGFNNHVVPFIRYRTGDLAVNSIETCSCGRSCRLLKRIEGRLQEYFIDSDGSAVTFTCSDDALWSIRDKIWAYQYIQDLPGRVRLNISPKAELSDRELEKVRSDFNEFYPGIRMEAGIVEDIERTPRGKFKYLIQNIRDENITY